MDGLKLFQLGSKNIFVKDGIIILVAILVTWILLFIIHKMIYRLKNIDIGRKFAFYQIIKYFLIVVSASVTLEALGFDVTVLIASSAALLVGLGMGLQHLFSDFVSGFIVLMDGTIKVGDIIELEGMIAIVKNISLRTTTVETRDDKNIILPNSTLTNKNLINWTHSEVTSRFEISVSVDYSSNVEEVMRLIKLAAESHPKVLKNPEPFVRLTEFEDSGIKFQVFFWTNDVFRVERAKSDIRVKMFELFNANHISIPFPQRVIHTRTN